MRSKTSRSIFKLRATRLDIGQRGLPGFLHHLAHLAGHLQPALAFEHRHFHRHDLAAVLRPRQAGHNTHFIRAFGFCLEDLLRTQEFINRFGDDR